MERLINEPPVYAYIILSFVITFVSNRYDIAIGTAMAYSIQIVFYFGLIQGAFLIKNENITNFPEAYFKILIIATVDVIIFWLIYGFVKLFLKYYY